MRETDPAGFSLRDAKRIARVVREVEREKRIVPGELAYTPRSENSTYVMLLDDCQSGQTCKAARLTIDESVSHQLLTINGDPPSSTSAFKIEWSLTETVNEETGESTLIGAEEVTGISPFATAEELYEKLREFSFIGERDVEVQCGTHERPVSRVNPDTGLVSSVYSPLRWIVTLRGDLEGTDVPLMRLSITTGSDWAWCSSEKSSLYDSGETIDILSGTPTGQTVTGDTILKRGAIGLALPVDESPGWVLGNLEPRNVDY